MPGRKSVPKRYQRESEMPQLKNVPKRHRKSEMPYKTHLMKKYLTPKDPTTLSLSSSGMPDDDQSYQMPCRNNECYEEPEEPIPGPSRKSDIRENKFNLKRYLESKDIVADQIRVPWGKLNQDQTELIKQKLIDEIAKIEDMYDEGSMAKRKILLDKLNYAIKQNNLRESSLNYRKNRKKNDKGYQENENKRTTLIHRRKANQKRSATGYIPSVLSTYLSDHSYARTSDQHPSFPLNAMEYETPMHDEEQLLQSPRSPLSAKEKRSAESTIPQVLHMDLLPDHSHARTSDQEYPSIPLTVMQYETSMDDDDDDYEQILHSHRSPSPAKEKRKSSGSIPQDHSYARTSDQAVSNPYVPSIIGTHPYLPLQQQIDPALFYTPEQEIPLDLSQPVQRIPPSGFEGNYPPRGYQGYGRQEPYQ